MLFHEQGATEVACWAHTGRKFDEAKSTEPELAAEAIERIGAPYMIERNAKGRGLSDEKRLHLRQEKSAVLVNELFAWMAKAEAVILLSLVMTAKAAGIDPKTYLRDILLRIARETDVAKLTPNGWKQNFQAQVEKRRQAGIRAAVGI